MAQIIPKKKPTLEEALVALNLISPKELDLVRIEAQKKNQTLNQVLRDMNLVSSEDLVRAYAYTFNLPYINLQNKTLSSDILYKIPEQVARTYHIIAFDEKDGKLQVAIESPQNLQAMEALEFIKEKFSYQVDLYVASAASIQYALEQYGTLKMEVTKTLKEIAVDLNVDEVVEETVETASDLSKIIQEAPISKMVAIIIKYAATSEASDIHIEPQEDKTVIRYRIDGVLQPTISLPKAIHPALVSRIKILANLKIDETRLPQDGRFHTIIMNRKIDFRVSTLPTASGEKVVLRLLEKTAGLKSLEKLGLLGKGYKVVSQAIKKPHGMILSCGPTGSGKTTTLYALLQKLNNPGVNIVTLEDPIEYKIEGINQSQIRPSIGFTFANGLRSILRQDPDVIMVGEIRDLETAEMAVHAALTGHIVLSTLHTNNAAGAIPRLIDMKVEPFLVASSLTTIIAQRLVRRVCEDCKENYSPPPVVVKEIQQEIAKLPQKAKKLIKIKDPITLWRGQGCKQCSQTGYRGRIGIFEVIDITEDIEPKISQGITKSQIHKLALEQGMIPLKTDGVLKVLEGITTMEEVWRVTEE